MSVLCRNRIASAVSAAPAPPQEPAASSAMSPPGRVPRAPAGATWPGLWPAVVFVVLIVFALQNIGGVGITFVWMDGSVPLAMALLVAALGTTFLPMAVGAVHGAHLRLSRRRW